MLPRNHPDRIRVSFDDHRLVANAGWYPFAMAPSWSISGRSYLRLPRRDGGCDARRDTIKACISP